MAFVNHKRGLMFVHIPKNAGTALGNMLEASPEWKVFSDHGRKENEGHLCLHLKGGELGHNKADYWLSRPGLSDLTPVAIIRNPWDRALSLYLFNLEKSAENLDQDWAVGSHVRLVREGFKTSWMPGGYFVDNHGRQWEYNTETGRAWAQNDSQSSWITQDTKVFRMEDQLEEACDVLGIALPKKANATSHVWYRYYYDDELKEQIATLFQSDIKLGGYTF